MEASSVTSPTSLVSIEMESPVIPHSVLGTSSISPQSSSTRSDPQTAFNQLIGSFGPTTPSITIVNRENALAALEGRTPIPEVPSPQGQLAAIFAGRYSATPPTTPIPMTILIPAPAAVAPGTSGRYYSSQAFLKSQSVPARNALRPLRLVEGSPYHDQFRKKRSRKRALISIASLTVFPMLLLLIALVVLDTGVKDAGITPGKLVFVNIIIVVSFVTLFMISFWASMRLYGFI